MADAVVVRRSTRHSAKVATRNFARTSVRRTRTITSVENSGTQMVGRESDSSESFSSLSDRRISHANHSEDGDYWNRASQTEGIHSTEGYVKTVDVLRDFRVARESFLGCSAVQYLKQYLKESDERPKTGFTYASGLSYGLSGDPSPMPVPNMSRYGLDHYARFTDKGYDYSGRSESSLSVSRASDTSSTHGLDFSESSRSLVSTPEPSRSIRDYLTRLYKQTVTTITTNTTTDLNAHNGHDNSFYGQYSSSTRRITPESRSGNDLLERQSCVTSGEFARSSTNLSSRTDWNYKNGGEVAAIRTGTPARAALAVSYRSAVKGRHFYGAAPAETAVEKITRRFIDIVTRNTITNTETTTREESRERRRRSWCLLPLLFLLLLLPFLGGLWWFAPVAMREKATAAHSVIHNFYHDLSSRSFGLAHDSKESLPIAPGLIFTNITKNTDPTGQIIYVKEPAPSCPAVKTCCDDVQLVKDQVALILARLQNLQRNDESERAEWERTQESKDDETRRSIDELRLMLIRVEKEILIRGQIIPQSVRDRENFSLEDVRRIVTESIQRYDEDKIGEPDHALESAGATVISTRCSEDYQWGHTYQTLFGIPIPFTSWTTSPRLAIQPDIRVGQCWAFKGDQGYLVIKLTGDVHPTSFTLEHLAKNLSPTGKIDSAPKNFDVYGLSSEQGPGYILGSYTYEDDGHSLQNFQIQTKLDPDTTFPFIELRITSNHGHPDYTCLYRFRVHGLLVKRTD